MKFKLSDYAELLTVFKEEGYKVVTMSEFMGNKINSDKVLALRHDVDRFPLNALQMMRVEETIGIKSTYYWRIKNHVYRPRMMETFAKKGFEIGYHYEDYSFSSDKDVAIRSFKSNWLNFRRRFQSKTVCRHGSPLSSRDSLDLLLSFDYKGLGIIGDTNLDIDYEKTYYITDNGLVWNDTKYNVRDKVSRTNKRINDKINEDFIQAIKSGDLPDFIHLNVHPDSFQKYIVLMYLNAFVIILKGYAKLGLKKLKWYK